MLFSRYGRRRMTVADGTLAVFTFFKSVRFLAYVPQIAKAIKHQSGAEAISFGTWALFLASYASAMAHAIENRGDWKMASLFLSNAVGCGVLPIAGWKRARHRRRRTAQTMQAGTEPSKANYRLAIAELAIGVALGAVAMAQTAAPGVVAITPEEMTWATQGRSRGAGDGAAQSDRRSGQAGSLHFASQISERLEDRTAYTPGLP
jgi:hypothetical protein